MLIPVRYFVVLILLLASSQVWASWSDFAHVTPETQQKYKLDVEISPLANRKNIFQVKFNSVGSKHKQAWLIVAAISLSKEEQKLRDYVWQSTPLISEISLKALLKPVSDKNSISSYYEVELTVELLKRAYIYIDFPFMVADGGYYYSIDLATFLAEYEKHTSQ